MENGETTSCQPRSPPPQTVKTPKLHRQLSRPSIPPPPIPPSSPLLQPPTSSPSVIQSENASSPQSKNEQRASTTLPKTSDTNVSTAPPSLATADSVPVRPTPPKRPPPIRSATISVNETFLRNANLDNSQKKSDEPQLNSNEQLGKIQPPRPAQRPSTSPLIGQNSLTLRHQQGHIANHAQAQTLSSPRLPAEDTVYHRNKRRTNIKSIYQSMRKTFDIDHKTNERIPGSYSLANRPGSKSIRAHSHYQKPSHLQMKLTNVVEDEEEFQPVTAGETYSQPPKNMISTEYSNYSTPRTLFRFPVSASKKALNQSNLTRQDSGSATFSTASSFTAMRSTQPKQPRQHNKLHTLNSAIDSFRKQIKSATISTGSKFHTPNLRRKVSLQQLSSNFSRTIDKIKRPMSNYNYGHQRHHVDIDRNQRIEDSYRTAQHSEMNQHSTEKMSPETASSPRPENQTQHPKLQKSSSMAVPTSPRLLQRPKFPPPRAPTIDIPSSDQHETSLTKVNRQDYPLFVSSHMKPIEDVNTEFQQEITTLVHSAPPTNELENEDHAVNNTETRKIENGKNEITKKLVDEGIQYESYTRAANKIEADAISISLAKAIHSSTVQENLALISPGIYQLFQIQQNQKYNELGHFLREKTPENLIKSLLCFVKGFEDIYAKKSTNFQAFSQKSFIRIEPNSESGTSNLSKWQMCWALPANPIIPRPSFETVLNQIADEIPACIQLSCIVKWITKLPEVEPTINDSIQRSTFKSTAGLFLATYLASLLLRIPVDTSSKLAENSDFLINRDTRLSQLYLIRNHTRTLSWLIEYPSQPLAQEPVDLEANSCIDVILTVQKFFQMMDLDIGQSNKDLLREDKHTESLLQLVNERLLMLINELIESDNFVGEILICAASQGDVCIYDLVCLYLQKIGEYR